jgi:transcriptional regulator with XRE-family HTH domain
VGQEPVAGPPVATPAAGRSRPRVGRHVKRWRQERGLTLAQVAERSGLNVGYLSQIENDKASPSLESLAAMADAIDVPISWFLLDSDRPPRIVRAAERRHWEAPGGGRIEEVDGGIPRDLRIVHAAMPPAGVSTGFHTHSGDEHHVVLSGRLRVTQGSTTAELGPGDYLLWDAPIPHDVEQVGDEPTTLLIIGHRSHRSETSRPEG